MPQPVQVEQGRPNTTLLLSQACAKLSLACLAHEEAELQLEGEQQDLFAPGNPGALNGYKHRLDRVAYTSSLAAPRSLGTLWPQQWG